MVALIARNAARTQKLSIASAGIIAAILMLHVPWIYAGAWWLLLSGAILARTRFLVALPGFTAWTAPQKLRVAGRTFAVMAVLQSLLMLFFPLVPVAVGAVLTMYLVGMCAGMVASVSGLRRAIAVYSLIVMGVIALVWTLTPDPTRGLLDRGLFALMCLMFAKVLLDYADNAQRVVAESYRIRTERVELNARLSEALATADAANRAKTRFLASASHDLRQPIHALSLFSGALLLRPLDPRSAAMAQQVDKAVSALGSQLDALLDISRLDAGVVRHWPGTVDLHATLTQLADEFRPQAEHKGLQLHLRCAPGLQVFTDALLLYRILGNLLSNAVRYTGSGRVELFAEAVDSECIVTVADSGPGIAEEEQDKVFEEFYQVSNPERDRSKGLGLGLAIVRRLVELLGLRLSLRSSPGLGTRFSLVVPIATDATALTREERPTDAMPADLRVLVVDDEETIRLGMKTLLEEMGFSVRLASSTESAMLASRQSRPSIVLADLRLHGRDDGMQTIQALRAVWPDLPALLISGDTAPERLREARDAGIELLHKPLQPALLRECIARALAA